MARSTTEFRLYFWPEMDQIPLAEAKDRLSEIVERIRREHGRVVITKHGRPAAVVVSVEDLASLEETLEVMSDPDLLAQVRQAEADIAAGKAERLSKEEILARIRRR